MSFEMLSIRYSVKVHRELFPNVPRTMSKYAWQKEFETGQRVKTGDLG